ncbi:MAG TPA: hypothetical protein PKC62_07845 [Ferruginibacter sp.]|nr:hypothetical protein [Bacteroidota bacterium]MCC6693701.1 hypothetical protein [Chitinophagaceae bacterium]HMT96586.1 hypothetical protein [Ferruginibacter sp.]HMU24208.1 hypothetical protein [Ferruginibacter sp.]
MKQILFLLLFCIIFLSCKKENNTDGPGCWNLVQNGYIIPGEICNKTRAEMEAQFGAQYFFVRTTEPRLCWKFTQGTNFNYRKNVTQSMVDNLATPYGVTAVQLACNSFCKWQVYIKRKSKVTGYYQPIQAINKLFVGATADSCAVLYAGREVIVQETADSLITNVFVEEQD